MRVLAIDASLRNTGVAIVDANNGKPQPVYFGTIHNASSMRSSSCLVAIRDRLAELIREHEPDCCALESVIYVQSYKTAIHPRRGARRGHPGCRRKRIADFRIFAQTNQTIYGRARRGRKRSGGIHGARSSRSNGNARCRRRGRAGNRSHASAHAGNGRTGNWRRHSNMMAPVKPVALDRMGKRSAGNATILPLCDST